MAGLFASGLVNPKIAWLLGGNRQEIITGYHTNNELSTSNEEAPYYKRKCATECDGIMTPMKLTLEETYLLERAKTQGYVTSDVRDNYDAVTEAYRDWCRIQRRPFLHIALGEITSRVILSLLEAESAWSARREKQLRQRIPTFCLCHANIEIESDYLIAGRVVNDLLPELQDWLLELSNEMIYRIHEHQQRRQPPA